MGCIDFIKVLKEHIPILSNQIPFILFFLIYLFLLWDGIINIFWSSDNWIEHLSVRLIHFFLFH